MPHDQHAPAETFAAALAEVTRYARRRAPTDAHADDAVQDAMVRALARPERFDPSRGNAAAWLTELTRLELLSARRDRQRHPSEALDPLALGENDNGRDVLALRALERCLDALDPLDRALVVGRTIEERSWAELSAELERPAHVLQHRLDRVLASLRAACLRGGLRPTTESEVATSIASEKSPRRAQGE